MKDLITYINWENTLLFIDEFHSFVEYLYTSDTCKKRIEMITYLQSFISKVSMGMYVDSQITDIENNYLKNCNLNFDFYINEYKTFEGIRYNIHTKSSFNAYYEKCLKNKKSNNVLF